MREKLGLWQRAWSLLAAPPQTTTSERLGRIDRWHGMSSRRRSNPPGRTAAYDADWSFSSGQASDRAFTIRLHRFLRDHVPILKSVIWTWTRLAASQHRFEIAEPVDETTRKRALAVLDALDRRIFPERIVRGAGFDALLIQLFNTLFTDGAVAGELTLLPSRQGLDRFGFIDTASLECDTDKVGHWQLYQSDAAQRVPLDSDAVFYWPLDSDAGHPVGRSLLAAVTFVARVEQELVRDMRLSMRNAGYHRLHVRVRPPTQGPAESNNDYTARANAYFDSTARALRDLEVDDNPITWDDVEISAVGPGGQVAATHNWYLNHRAMVEDVIAGCHLAPFMLGYSYGTTQTWAKFKYEMVGRQISTLQRAASRFCEWIAGIELALAGVDATVRHVFDNRLEFDRRERFEADRIQTEVTLRQLEAGLLTIEQARQRLEITTV